MSTRLPIKMYVRVWSYTVTFNYHGARVIDEGIRSVSMARVLGFYRDYKVYSVTRSDNRVVQEWFISPTNT